MRNQQERQHQSPEPSVNGETKTKNKKNKKNNGNRLNGNELDTVTPETLPTGSSRNVMRSQGTTMVILCVIIVLLLFLLVQLHVRNGQWGHSLSELQQRINEQQTVLHELLAVTKESKNVVPSNDAVKTRAAMWEQFAMDIADSKLSPQEMAQIIHKMVNAPAEEEDADYERKSVKKRKQQKQVQQQVQEEKQHDDVDEDHEEEFIFSFYSGEKQRAFIDSMNEGEMERREMALQMDQEVQQEVDELVKIVANSNTTNAPSKVYLPVSFTKKKVHQLMLRTRSVLLPAMEDKTLEETTTSAYSSMDMEEKKRIKESLEKRRKELALDKLFPVHVFDGHDRSLIHWLDHIENGTMECKNLTILHFDSHPDMGPGTNINLDMLNNRTELHPNVDIASFILPFIMKGCTHRVIWVRPKWCAQFDDTPPGKPYVFKVGVDPETKSGVCTDSKEEYFETHYCKEPLNGASVQYEVMTLTDWEEFDKEEKQDILSNVLRLDEDPNPTILLDIDEDYFSTINPMGIIAGHVLKDFKDLAEHMEIMLEPKAFCAPSREEKDIRDSVSKLNAGISQLFKFGLRYRFGSEDIVTGADAFLERMEDLMAVWCDGRKAAREYFEMLYEFFYEVEENQPNVLGMTLVDALPHYLANFTEVEDMAQKMQEMLHIVHNDLAVPHPRVVTIARSLKDDYTPPSHWPFIERQVMQLLSNVYGKGKDAE